MTIKELAPYLPYELKVHHLSWNTELIMDSDGGSVTSLSIDDVPEYAAPILRPLLDLTKEIEHNGEIITPIFHLQDVHPDYHVYEENNECYIQDLCNLNMFYMLNCIKYSAKLFEWHFDVFGLIEKGEAIDINTL